MDSEELVLTLSKKLAERGYINIIQVTEEDKSPKNHVLEDAEYTSPVKIKGTLRPIMLSHSSTPDTFNLESEMKKLDEKALEVGANYLFVSQKTQAVGGALVWMANAEPYAVLGEDEISILEEEDTYVPYDVYNAASSIGLKLKMDYMDLYESKPEMFKDFFKRAKEEMKLEVIGKLYENGSDFTDPLGMWMSSNYMHLIDKVIEGN